jgi:hypothetical protein
MRDKIIISLTILIFSIWNTSAQKWEKYSISLSSASLSAGWYKPSMNYWNNTFLPNANTSDKFGGNIMYSTNLSFDLPLNTGARIGAWYWQDDVNGGNGGSFNTLKINFTGISIGAFYKYRQGIYWEIKPYAGIDGSFLIIQDKYDVSGTISKKSGNDVVFTPFLGIERIFYNKIVLGVEYGYVLGHYRQDVATTSGTTNPKVSVNGHKIGITLGYKFP